MRNAPATIGLLVGLLATAPALAGTVIEVDSGDQGISRMLISGSQMRMEGGGAGDHVSLFDAASEELTVVNPAERSYQVMTRQHVRNMARQMDQMREQIEKQLQNMPEEQRAQMRKQMEQTMPGAAARAEVRVEATGGSATVAGTACREARVYRGDQATHEVCVADPGALGIPSGDFDTMMGMFDFFSEIAGTAGGHGELGADAMERMMAELGGMPVRARPLQGGTAWELVGVETRSIDPGQFEVPSGYSKRQPMSGQMQ